MIELLEWQAVEPQNPGEPGWWTLAVKVTGETPTSHQSVFAAVEVATAGNERRVLIMGECADVERPVITPFELIVRTTIEGVSTYRLMGKDMEETFEVRTPPDRQGQGT